jgi:hypothetical protein
MMKRNSLAEVCEAVAAGEHQSVENMQLRYTGEVVDCTRDKLVVEAFGHRFDWPRALCRAADDRHDPLGPPSNV